MRKFRFVTKTHEDVVAENVEEAIQVFKDKKERGLSSKIDEVMRIEVLNEIGEFEPFDHPLRSGDVTTHEEAQTQMSA